MAETKAESRAVDGEEDESGLETMMATTSMDETKDPFGYLDEAEEASVPVQRTKTPVERHIIQWPDGARYNDLLCFVCGARADETATMDIEVLTMMGCNSVGGRLYSSFCPGDDSKCKTRVQQEVARLMNDFDILPLPETHSLRQVQSWTVRIADGKEIATQPGDYLCWNRTSTADAIDDATKRVLCFCCCVKDKLGEHETVRVPLAALATLNKESFYACVEKGLQLTADTVWTADMLARWNKALESVGK